MFGLHQSAWERRPFLRWLLALQCPMHGAGDMESEKAHVGGIVVRDLSCVVSNYRSTKTLDQYCKEQGVVGADTLSACAPVCGLSV